MWRDDERTQQITDMKCNNGNNNALHLMHGRAMEEYGNENSLEIIITHHHIQKIVQIISVAYCRTTKMDRERVRFTSQRHRSKETAKVEIQARNICALLESHEQSAVMLINKHENWFK